MSMCKKPSGAIYRPIRRSGKGKLGKLKWYSQVTSSDGPTKMILHGTIKEGAEEEVELQHRGVDRLILRRDSSHGTQPAGVERADEEVHHDAPLRLLAELRDQGKAIATTAR